MPRPRKLGCVPTLPTTQVSDRARLRMSDANDAAILDPKKTGRAICHGRIEDAKIAQHAQHRLTLFIRRLVAKGRLQQIRQGDTSAAGGHRPDMRIGRRNTASERNDHLPRQ